MFAVRSPVNLQTRPGSTLSRIPNVPARSMAVRCAKETQKDVSVAKKDTDLMRSLTLGGSAFLYPALFAASEAMAKEGQYGLLEGRSLALIHPAAMLCFFGATGYAGYLGWQWRSLREVGNEVRDLKKKLPPVGEDGTRPASPLDAEIKELDEIRKKLSTGNFRDRHFNMGSILLGGGVSIAVFGCMNTYLRTGKLFPGPHLFAGASIVVLWALAASLVPQMQKGNESARIAHIGLNTLNLVLFAWQVPTGFEIVDKVFQFTTWP